MSHDEYAELPGVNWSALRHLWRGSPLHYHHRLTHPEPPTAAMLAGRAAHLAMLEPDRLPLECVVWTEGDRRGKAWLDFKAANEGKLILKTEEYQRALSLRDAVRGNRDAMDYLRDAETEKTITWTDAETRLGCKARVDAWNPSHVDGPAVVDLKTMRSIDKRAVQNQVAALGIHLQLAHYRAGLMASQRVPFVRVVIVAVEQEPPHDCAVFLPEPSEIQLAAEEVTGLLVRLRHHLATNTWPGRFGEPQPLPLPPWVYGQGELTMTYEED